MSSARRPSSRPSLLTRLYLARLERAGVQKLSTSHAETIQRFEAAAHQVRAERPSILAVVRGAR